MGEDVKGEERPLQLKILYNSILKIILFAFSLEINIMYQNKNE